MWEYVERVVRKTWGGEWSRWWGWLQWFRHCVLKIVTTTGWVRWGCRCRWRWGGAWERSEPPDQSAHRQIKHLVIILILKVMMWLDGHCKVMTEHWNLCVCDSSLLHSELTYPVLTIRITKARLVVVPEASKVFRHKLRSARECNRPATPTGDHVTPYWHWLAATVE